MIDVKKKFQDLAVGCYSREKDDGSPRPDLSGPGAQSIKLRVVLAPWTSLCSIGGAAFPLPCHSATCIVARFYLASGLEQSEGGYLLGISWLSRPQISWQLGLGAKGKGYSTKRRLFSSSESGQFPDCCVYCWNGKSH